MPSFQLGEVVILPFSYTDLQSRKRRPAIVLLDSGDEDVLVAKVTSKRYESQYDLELHHWTSAGLLAPSFVRVNKLLAVEKAQVIQRVGMLESSDLDRLKETFRTMI